MRTNLFTAGETIIARKFSLTDGTALGEPYHVILSSYGLVKYMGDDGRLHAANESRFAKNTLINKLWIKANV